MWENKYGVHGYILSHCKVCGRFLPKCDGICDSCIGWARRIATQYNRSMIQVFGP